MATTSLNLPYLLLSGVILVGVVLAFVIFTPLWNEARQLNTEAETIRTTVTERQQFLQTLDQKKAELDTNQQHERQLRAVIPGDEALDDVTRLLHRAGEASGMVIVTIDNASQSAQSRKKALEARGKDTGIPASVVPLLVTVEARGTYPQLRVFLERLERSVRLMDVQKVSVSRQENQIDQLIAKLDVQFYQQIPENDGP